MKTGLSHTSSVSVGAHNTARAMGSGDLEVFATPAMAALMESAAMLAVAGHLDEGQTTVGTALDIVHTRATGIGAQVSATARLTETDGRRLVFSVEAYDAEGIVGRGVHTRFIVDRARFMAKLQKAGAEE